MTALPGVLATLAVGPAGGQFPLPVERAPEVVSVPVDWASLVPMLIVLGGALAMLVVGGFFRRDPFPGVWALASASVAAAGLVASIGLWFDVQENGPRSIVGGAVGIDGFSVFVTAEMCLALFVASLVVAGYQRREGNHGVEVYALMLLAGLGGMIMASANDLVVAFLGLETLSIALYVLAGSAPDRAGSREAAMKYFLLGAFSSAFLLYGIALVYGATGSTNLVRIADFLATTTLFDNGLLLAGFALLLVGLGFKVAAVPFHAWTPDVYQGSPTPFTGFMAAVAKAAGIALLLRVFVVTFDGYRLDWQPAVWALAALSLLVGSALAIVQTDVKRMMAYSSISHAGFILVAVEAANSQGVAAALFYSLAYTFMVLGSFAVIALVARTGDRRTSIDDYRGLGRERPGLALTFTVLLLAQAGIPLTGGFVAKFTVIGAAVEAGSYVLAVLAMVASVIAAFVYLRIIVAMYLSDPAEAPAGRERIRIPAPVGIALAISVVVTLGLGILPDRAVNVAREATPVLVAQPTARPVIDALGPAGLP